MSEPHDQDGARPDRRVFLTLAGAATLAAAGGRAWATPMTSSTP